MKLNLTPRRIKKLGKIASKAITKQIEENQSDIVFCKDCGTMQLNKDCYAEYDLKTKEVKFQCQKCYEKEEKPKGYPIPLKEGER